MLTILDRDIGKIALPALTSDGHLEAFTRVAYRP